MSVYRLLIIGDSFSASRDIDSWTQIISPKFGDVINLSSNGSSEYRIYKKLLSIDVMSFSHTIIVHTSPYRIYVDHSPLHQSSHTHRQCDLIYQDVKSADITEFSKNALWYFENLFDLDQAKNLHELLIDKMIDITSNTASLHLTFFKQSAPEKVKDLSDIWKKNPGDINHMDAVGNIKVAKFINNFYKFFGN